MTIFSDSPRRPRLTDILNGGANNVKTLWEKTEPAKDFVPLPRGTYVAHVVSGELSKAKTGTPGYKLTFKVIDGEYAGRQVWHDLWLTSPALPMTKRDLAKLGIAQLEQIDEPLKPGIRCKVHVALRCDDDGTESNKVRSFDVIGQDPDPTVDPDFGADDVADKNAEGAAHE